MPEGMMHMRSAELRFKLWHAEARAIFRKLGAVELNCGLTPVKVRRLERLFERFVLARSIASQYRIWAVQLTRAIRKARPSAMISIAPNARTTRGSVHLIKRSEVRYAKRLAARLAAAYAASRQVSQHRGRSLNHDVR